MDGAKNAEFTFEGYQLPEFSCVALDVAYNNINVNFDPSGNYDEKTGVFKLLINFTAIGLNAQGEPKEIIKARIDARFKFLASPSLPNLPSFFYANSIAIVFPYLRAFVSTLTLQANVPIIVMPVLNLSALEQTLIKNTTAAVGIS